jgi:hypothetical protein
MNLRSVKPHDLVHCNRRGRRFWGRVEERLDRALSITPVTSNINYYRVSSREVTEHYARRPNTAGKVSTRVIRPQDLISFEHDQQTVIARVIDRRTRGRVRVLPLTPAGDALELPAAEITAHYARRQRPAGRAAPRRRPIEETRDAQQ